MQVEFDWENPEKILFRDLGVAAHAIRIRTMVGMRGD